MNSFNVKDLMLSLDFMTHFRWYFRLKTSHVFRASADNHPPCVGPTLRNAWCCGSAAFGVMKIEKRLDKRHAF